MTVTLSWTSRRVSAGTLYGRTGTGTGDPPAVLKDPTAGEGSPNHRHPHPRSSMPRPSPLTVLRSIGAVLLAIQGVVHLRLWLDGYRSIPTIGPLFLAGVVVAFVLAAALAVTPRTSVALAGAALSAGQVGALVLASTVGLLGFETAWTWTGAQGAALWSELLAVVVLLGIVRWRRGAGRSARRADPNALQPAGS